MVDGSVRHLACVELFFLQNLLQAYHAGVDFGFRPWAPCAIVPSAMRHRYIYTTVWVYAVRR